MDGQPWKKSVIVKEDSRLGWIRPPRGRLASLARTLYPTGPEMSSPPGKNPTPAGSRPRPWRHFGTAQGALALALTRLGQWENGGGDAHTMRVEGG